MASEKDINVKTLRKIIKSEMKQTEKRQREQNHKEIIRNEKIQNCSKYAEINQCKCKEKVVVVKLLKKNVDEILCSPYFENISELFYEELFPEIFFMNMLLPFGKSVPLLAYDICWNEAEKCFEAALVMPYLEELGTYLQQLASYAEKGLCSGFQPEFQNSLLHKMTEILIKCGIAVKTCLDNHVLHNDIKLENFFCSGFEEDNLHDFERLSGSELNVYIGDFGSAEYIGRNENRIIRLQKHDKLILTREYTAPESASSGISNEETQVYALGLMYSEIFEFFIGQMSVNIVNSNIVFKIHKIITNMTERSTLERTKKLNQVLDDLNKVFEKT